MRLTSRGQRIAQWFLISNLSLAGICGCAEAADDSCRTLEQSARAALTEAMPLSAQFEYGGALYVMPNGCHEFAAPRTSGDKYNVDLHITLPLGGHLVGIYHTHPGIESRGREFSPHDVETQAALRVPSFIGVVRTGAVYVLDKAPLKSRRESVQGDVAVFGRLLGE